MAIEKDPTDPFEYNDFNNLSFYENRNSFKDYEHVKTDLIWGDLSTPIPKYTVIITTFKRPLLIQEAINSVLNQKNFKNYEILVIDNDHERNTPTEKMMLKKYSKYKNIFYYKQQEWSRGMTNKSVTLARTEWFTVLCDDDLFLPDFFSTLDKIVTTHPDCEAVACPYKIQKYDFKKQKKLVNTTIRSWIREKIKNINSKYLDIFPQVHFVGKYTFDDYYARRAIFPFLGVIYKTKNIKELGGWNNHFGGGADLALNVNYLSKYNIYYTTERLTEKREGIGNNSTVKSMMRDFLFIEYLLFNTFKDKLKHLEFDEKYLKSFAINNIINWENFGFADVNFPIDGKILFKEEDATPEMIEYYGKKAIEYNNILNKVFVPLDSYTRSKNLISGIK